MSSLGGPSLQDAIALAQRMAQNPADSVVLAGQLVELLSSMPPAAGELLSRPAFERASLWTLGCSFENVGLDEPPPQIIRCQHDVWVRGVTAQAYPELAFADDDLATLTAAVQLFRQLRFSTGNNGRGLFETNWRLDAKQGFISKGMSEIVAPASMITGDGCWTAAKDWMLQKDQTIEVRVRSLLGDLQLDTTVENLSLRWVVVTFWVEELDQPSVQ